jgi:oxidoreductase family protein
MTTPKDDPRPVPPPRPADDDCCRKGCTPCIFELYDEAMERYEASLREWIARHPSPDNDSAREQ